jgi:hypothetical protein
MHTARVLLVVMAAILSPLAAAPAEADAPLRVILNGHTISPTDASSLHCTDVFYPRIDCFSDAARRDDVVRRRRRLTATSSASLSSVVYVTFYADINFGGASFSTAGAISDLTAVGWNDRISSFKSLNGGRPAWWRDAGFAGTLWRWSAGTWVSYVGDGANDQFSSVANVP